MKRPWWMAFLPAGAVLARLLGRSLRCAFINYETACLVLEERLNAITRRADAAWSR